MSVSAVSLRCDHMLDPVGIDDEQPLLGWAATGGSTGFQIVVGRDRSAVAAGHGDTWDSGQVDSGRCHAVYGGPAPASRGRYWWSVRLWDQHGDMGSYCAPASFEYGLRPRDWVVDWLGYGSGWDGQALLLRGGFDVPADVVGGRAYVAGIGWHQVRLNGHLVDDRVLEPAPTTTSRRVPVSTYVLDEALSAGANRIGLMLAGGWSGRPQVRVQIHLDRADGSEQVIGSTTRSWQVAPAPIVASSPYDGEVYDARLVRPGWDTTTGDEPAVPGPDDQDDPWAVLFGSAGSRVRGWTAAQSADPPAGALRALPMPVARVTEESPPSSVTEPVPGTWVIDAGTNGAGWVRVRLHGCPRGRRIVLRYAESVHPDGTVDQDNLREARAWDVYVCGGDTDETYEPTFTSHGFRYVQVDGAEGPLTRADVQVRRVRTDLAPRATFRGNELLERIYTAVVRTEASNTLGLLSDCPQRAERHGWLNDLTNRLDSAVLAHDIAPLLAKVLDDIGDAQRPDGAIPDTVPFRWGYEVGDPVCLAPLLIPRLLQRHWGDTRAAARAYPIARGWLAHLRDRCEDDVLSFTHWGDWAESKMCEHERVGLPGIAARLAESTPPAPEPVSRRTPGALVSTACLAFGLARLSDLAVQVGDDDGAQWARQQGRAVTAGFRAAFRDPATGSYGTGSQGSLACALGFGLVPTHEVDHTVALLAAEVSRHGHLTTGNIATKYVLETLSDHGRHDLALSLARREDYPSWGYMLAHGATTLWERWEELTGGGMNSHNHGMLGAIGSWLITRHAGLSIAEDAVGADRWVMRVPRVAGDDGAAVELDSVRGQAALRWERAAGVLTVDVTVPAGATAQIRLPVPSTQIVDGRQWRAVGAAEAETTVTEGRGRFRVDVR